MQPLPDIPSAPPASSTPAPSTRVIPVFDYDDFPDPPPSPIVSHRVV